MHQTEQKLQRDVDKSCRATGECTTWLKFQKKMIQDKELKANKISIKQRGIISDKNNSYKGNTGLDEVIGQFYKTFQKLEKLSVACGKDVVSRILKKVKSICKKPNLIEIGQQYKHRKGSTNDSETYERRLTLSRFRERE